LENEAYHYITVRIITPAKKWDEIIPEARGVTLGALNFCPHFARLEIDVLLPPLALLSHCNSGIPTSASVLLK